MRAELRHWARLKERECDKAEGWRGNGIQCMDGNGTLSAMPWQQVEVTANVTVGLYNDTHVENEFNHGGALEGLLSEMESAGSSCSGEACEASYEVTEV